MGDISNLEEKFNQALKDAIEEKLSCLEPPLKWMTARGLARYLDQQTELKADFQSQIVSSLLIEQLLYEMENSGFAKVRRAALPSKKTLDVLWGSVEVVGKADVMPVEKQDIQDDFFGDSSFIPNDNTKKCFISHSHKDVKDAIEIGKELLKHNVYPWMAETDIAYADVINYEIQQAIASSDYFLIYVTENAIKSVWTEKELGFAQGKKRLIVANNLGFDQVISADKNNVVGATPFFQEGAERLKISGESVSIFLDLIKNQLNEQNELGMLEKEFNNHKEMTFEYNVKRLDDYLHHVLYSTN